MNEFEQQKVRTLQNYIEELNSDQRLCEIREIYITNFEKISEFVKKVGSRGAVEDIALIQPSLSSQVFSNRLLLKIINDGIAEGRITIEDFKSS